MPNTTIYGSGPYPTVLMVPPTVFHEDVDDNGNRSELVATADLQLSGFLVFQIDTRVAGQGINGQVSSGVFPAQTDDLERQILAALNDPLHQSNNSIYLVGGSSGGCLALWAMLQSSNPNVPLWNEAARLHIKAVVSLSGPSNLGDYTNPGGTSAGDLTEFQNGGDYYTGIPLGTYNGTVLYNASPVSLVSSATSSPPVMLYGTKTDPVPYQQANDMYNALINKFGNPSGKFTEYAPLNNTGDHAFHYWHEQNMQVMPSDCVSHQVITFLQANP